MRDNRDKTSTENTVSNVATWVIAGLRDRKFGSLPELAEAIGERMHAYNHEPFQKCPGLAALGVHRRGAAAADVAAGGGLRISRGLYG